jgi:hypothetical protein
LNDRQRTSVDDRMVIPHQAFPDTRTRVRSRDPLSRERNQQLTT